MLTGHFLSNWSFCQPVIWSNYHLTKLWYHKLVISSTWHFINRSFCPAVILSAGYFVYYSFCLMVILSANHFVNYAFLSTMHFVSLFDVLSIIFEWVKNRNEMRKMKFLSIFLRNFQTIIDKNFFSIKSLWASMT